MNTKDVFRRPAGLLKRTPSGSSSNHNIEREWDHEENSTPKQSDGKTSCLCSLPEKHLPGGGNRNGAKKRFAPNLRGPGSGSGSRCRCRDKPQERIALDKKREVIKLSSVFDVNIHHALNLPRNMSVRVLLRYDRKEDRKEFTVLTKDMDEGMNSQMIAWLEQNVDVSDVMYGIQENALEADLL